VIRHGTAGAQTGAGIRWPDSDQRRWSTWLGGGGRADWWRARRCCVEPHGDDRLPQGQWRGRRQYGDGPHVRLTEYAHHAVMAIVPGLRRCRLSGTPIRLSVADRNIAEWVGDDGKWSQWHRGDQDDLAPGRQPGRCDTNHTTVKKGRCADHSIRQSTTSSFAGRGWQAACQHRHHIDTATQRSNPEAGRPIGVIS
jgi:hypothetical protein